MPRCLERIGYRAIRCALLPFVWPLVLLGMVAEALTYIDPKFEEVM
jgi:hypothetical protein